MPIVAVVTDERGEVVRRIPDPTGGTCDAAGDFDRLIPTTTGGLLDGVEQYGDTTFNRVQMAQVAAEMAGLLDHDDLSGPEECGLRRLRALADKVATDVHVYLRFRGD